MPLSVILFALLGTAKGGYFTANQALFCPGTPGNDGPSCHFDGTDSCGALPFFSGLYGSVTCSSNTWNLKLCADSGCGECAPTITQTMGSDCISIPSVSLPPPLPSFPGFQVYVDCNKLTILSFCLIGCAAISVLCCGCRLCLTYCCREEKKESFTAVQESAAPLLSSINSPSISKEDLIEELFQAKKRHEKLSAQLIAVQQDLLDVRDNLSTQQTTRQQPTQYYSRLG